ncbi:MAG: HAMP domain-containing sensor histidine kinase [Parafilimonas sp.]
MITVLKIKKRGLINLAAIVLLSFVGFVEWQTGYQLSFAVFYLLVLCFFALYRNVSKKQILFYCLYTTLLALAIELSSSEPFNDKWIPYGNALLRLAGYIIITSLCYALKTKHANLLELNESLKNLHHEKNKIIGIAAHDLRNPFASIQTITELLIPVERNKEALKFLEMIHRISNNSLRLVDNLLNVSQIELGILQLNIQQHDYVYFIRNIIVFQQLLASNKKIKIELNCVHDEIYFGFDEIHIEQVINNLLMNAVKYSKPGSRIKIKVTKTDAGVLTEVIDEGVGIPENEIGKLFNFFQKTSAKPTSGEKGNGLGLAISKKIVTTHGGTIHVKSVLGKGSNFYFFLPATFVFSKIMNN